MDETELQALRRKRLADWLEMNGGAHNVCERRNLERKVESHISQIINGYSFGPRAARNMEEKLGLDAGYLDGPANDKSAASLSPFALELAKLYDQVTGRIARTVAYNSATQAILQVMREHGPEPTDKPDRAAKAKKQRA
jgi:hypothetical protein